jgi:hypothetical protein
MANEPTNEFPLSKNTYAAFDAIALRNLIIERLNEQGIFTDQNYIGSNLAAIIDIVSYAFNTLIFYLNRTSTESMFTEAQLYENISRIVKLLDYKPIGYQTSTISFQCSADNRFNSFDSIGQVYVIPRYSYLTVGNNSFSFNEDVSFSVGQQGVSLELTDVSNRKLLFQGVYRENPIYIAAGDPNETITINTTNALIDHFNIDVYVFEQDQNRWTQYTETPSLYTEQPYARKFEKRLNQNLLYEISFGDNINGRQLKEGDSVAIYYLQSSGEAAVVGPGMLADSSVARVVYDTSLFQTIINDVKQDQESIILNNALFGRLFFNNVAGSTLPKAIESADNIRKNAPANFKSQYRLVTKEDYETFIKTNFSGFISDVKVFNNWDYVSKYLKYFNDIQVTPTAFRQILLNQVSYADSCNFNNVYVCCIPKVARGSTLKYLLPAQKELLLSNLIPMKSLTTEVTFADPIYKAVSFGINLPGEEIVVTDRDFTQVEIIKTVGSNRNNQSIIADIVSVFQQFFNPVNQTIGGMFDHSTLTSNILTIDGISSIRTVRYANVDQETSEFVEGLSFYFWNPTYPDLDKMAVTRNLNMKDFEFLYFDGLSTIAEKFVVTEEPYSNTRF